MRKVEGNVQQLFKAFLRILVGSGLSRLGQFLTAFEEGLPLLPILCAD